MDELREFAAGRRFAGALQAAEHEDRRVAAEVQRMIDGAHQVHELAMHDADEMLRRVEGREDLRRDKDQCGDDQSLPDWRPGETSRQQGTGSLDQVGVRVP